MTSLLERFRALPDYRKCKQVKFNVGEILYLALLAQLAGANGYDDMATWIKAKKYELRKLLGHPFIVPAYTTVRNVFMGINTKALDEFFETWSHECAKSKGMHLTIVAADGKTMRGSLDRCKDQKARHIVSLFLTQKRLTLAQSEVQDKSNEIPALLALLDALKLEHCVLTVDALHTQNKGTVREAMFPEKNLTKHYTKAA